MQQDAAGGASAPAFLEEVVPAREQLPQLSSDFCNVADWALCRVAVPGREGKL